ncbi:unnamed protein product [Rotaria sp. Silwood1]|nr:unnamed protein product [Rotaria sp. Silwood1]CAF3353517.1 unnamed protein product [Rotaria sp. Silwood1]CAF3376781.1 unnamed protein product [Rotaria sp. Silwood1]CAF3383068.1 unnamed protein product [Rotaria sp. Silwood1]CAF3385308.1 unnamed protein product [Rotaria sp. Silwood1]
MFATADCTNHYPEQTIYDSEWTENTRTGISWLNLLTSQPIPEETDSIHDTCTPVQSNRQSSCSSSSVESCYVVLEIQRRRSVDETPNQIKQDQEEVQDEELTEKAKEKEVYEDTQEEEVQVEEEQIQKVVEEEEEEVEEEIEELNFAQTISNDNHNVHYEQFAVPMATEIPREAHVVKRQQEKFIAIEEYAQVTEPIIQEMSNDILFDKAKTLSQFTKRMKAMSYLSIKEQQNYSPSFDDESLNITKLKTIRKINEYYPTAISTVTAEQQLPTIQYSNLSRYSTTSLDSIENKSLSSSPIPTRITTTFSNLSSQRTSNSTQIQRTGPTMGTTTLARTFAFDRACMEKYGRVQEQENKPVEIPLKSNGEIFIKKQIELSDKKTGHTEQLLRPENTINCRSFTNTIPTSFYIGGESSMIDELEFEHCSTNSTSLPISNSLSKASSIICLMKKYARTVKSDYLLSHNKSNTVNLSSEPKLLQVKYLDGRLPLNDEQARESLRKNSTLTDSIASRLNRFGLQNTSSTQDLSSSPTPSFYASYRKRMFNRFRSYVENNFIQPPPSSVPQSRPWQHKTISELLSEKKYVVNRHR